jgi:hypothetical protein
VWLERGERGVRGWGDKSLVVVERSLCVCGFEKNLEIKYAIAFHVTVFF